jgi:integrase
MLAAYGLRPHEIYHLDLSELPKLIVLEDTKTKGREVYPIFPNWFVEWDLKEAIYPEVNTDKANIDLGGTVSKYFKKNELGIIPYDLRRAYALRCILLGIDSSIIARWMGHSLQTFYDHYQEKINAIAMKKIWQALEGKFREE